MRPTWKGSISFGLVYIPISVYPATREEKLSFRQLRKTDLSPIKYKKVAEADMKEVPADQIVKGFEYERGRYIVLSDEDFEKCGSNPPTRSTLPTSSTLSWWIRNFLQAVLPRATERWRKSVRAPAQGVERNG